MHNFFNKNYILNSKCFQNPALNYESELNEKQTSYIGWPIFIGF